MAILFGCSEPSDQNVEPDAPSVSATPQPAEDLAEIAGPGAAALARIGLMGSVPSSFEFAYDEGNSSGGYVVFDNGSGTIAIGRALEEEPGADARSETLPDGRTVTVEESAQEIRANEDVGGGIHLVVVGRGVELSTVLQVAQSSSYNATSDRDPPTE